MNIMRQDKKIEGYYNIIVQYNKANRLTKWHWQDYYVIIDEDHILLQDNGIDLYRYWSRKKGYTS